MPSPEKATLANGNKKYNWVYTPKIGKMAKIIHPDQNPTQNGQLNREFNNDILDKKFRGLLNSSEYIIIYVNPKQESSNKNIIKCI